MANTLKADVASDIRLSLPNMTVKDDTVSNVLRNIRTIRGRVQVAPVHNSTTAKVSEHVSKFDPKMRKHKRCTQLFVLNIRFRFL